MSIIKKVNLSEKMIKEVTAEVDPTVQTIVRMPESVKKKFVFYLQNKYPYMTKNGKMTQQKWIMDKILKAINSQKE